MTRKIGFDYAREGIVMYFDVKQIRNWKINAR